MLAASAAVYGPWLAYGWFAVGRLLPESGAATRFLSLAYAPFFGTGPAELVTRGPDAPFVLLHLQRAVSVLKLTPPVHGLFRAVERAGGAASMSEGAVLAGNLVGAVLLAAFAVWFVRRARRSRVSELMFLLVFGVSLVAAYSAYIFGLVFFIRYLFPVHFVATIFVAVFAGDAVSWVRSRGPVLRRAAVAACTLYAAGHLYMACNCCFRSAPVYHFYDVAQWVKENTDRNETIGVFQSGTIGYLSERRVVNLDGKVNGYALAALREGTLEEYLREESIDVLMDDDSVIRLFLGDDHHLDETRCFTGGGCGLPGWIGYRINGHFADHVGSGGAQAGSAR